MISNHGFGTNLGMSVVVAGKGVCDRLIFAHWRPLDPRVRRLGGVRTLEECYLFSTGRWHDALCLWLQPYVAEIDIIQDDKLGGPGMQ